MTVYLSPHIEGLAKQKAGQAGVDVERFVALLIENATPEQALLPPPSDQRVAEAIAAGLASNIEGPMDNAFWADQSERLEQHVQRDES